jgi:hypothetical protein
MSFSVNIKKVFLSFAQKYYKDDPVLTWTADSRTTKIFIVDKYAIDPSVVEKMPAIVLNLGSRGFAQTSIDQRLTLDLSKGIKGRTDLLQCSITYHIISKNGVEAESIADGLLLRIMGFKDEFRKRGIHQILRSSIGEEQVIRGDASIRMSMVPVYVQFTVQAGAKFAEEIYSLSVFENTAQQYEGLDFYVVSGQDIVFFTPPTSGLSLYATYTGRFTLAEHVLEPLTGVVDGINKIFETTEEVFTTQPLISGTTNTINA